MASEDSLGVLCACGCWRVVVEEWDVEETGSVIFEGTVEGSLGWGVDGASSSLSSSQEIVSAGLRAASDNEGDQPCGRNG